MSIHIYSHGTSLTTEEQDAGRDAALAYFREHGADPIECHEAMREIADFDESAGGTISSRTQMRAVIWHEAETAAIFAATKGWARTPDDLSLGLA